MLTAVDAISPDSFRDAFVRAAQLSDVRLADTRDVIGMRRKSVFGGSKEVRLGREIHFIVRQASVKSLVVGYDASVDVDRFGGKIWLLLSSLLFGGKLSKGGFKHVGICRREMRLVVGKRKRGLASVEGRALTLLR